MDITNGADAHAEAPAKLRKITGNAMTTAMRGVGQGERDWEERRLRRRNNRKGGGTDGGTSVSRSGSVAPGTPGSVAPEPEKPLTKKEIKKSAMARAAEASSHANQNQTSSLFVGLHSAASIFGKNKGKGGKTYAWMNAGGSGANTPTRTPSGKTGGSAPGTPSPAPLALTTEGRNRLGNWREDKEKGKNIQLRDWVVVLKADGNAVKALQQAYDKLDASNPK
jgi:hypothetical protein